MGVFTHRSYRTTGERLQLRHRETACVSFPVLQLAVLFRSYLVRPMSEDTCASAISCRHITCRRRILRDMFVAYNFAGIARRSACSNGSAANRLFAQQLAVVNMVSAISAVHRRSSTSQHMLQVVLERGDRRSLPFLTISGKDLLVSRKESRSNNSVRRVQRTSMKQYKYSRLNALLARSGIFDSSLLQNCYL